MHRTIFELEKKFNIEYVVSWVKLFREVRRIENEDCGLKKAKQAFDRTHPDYVEYLALRESAMEQRRRRKLQWIRAYRKRTGKLIPAAVEAFRAKFGY